MDMKSEPNIPSFPIYRHFIFKMDSQTYFHSIMYRINNLWSRKFRRTRRRLHCWICSYKNCFHRSRLIYIPQNRNIHTYILYLNKSNTYLKYSKIWTIKHRFPSLPYKKYEYFEPTHKDVDQVGTYITFHHQYM